MIHDLSHLIYRTKFNYRKWVEHAGDFPVHIDLELSGKCQLACTMCAFGDGGFEMDRQGMMPRHIAMEAIKQAAYGGASSIKFNFRGEPGLCKFLSECVQEAKHRGIFETAINTNLTAFTFERLKNLCDAGLDLIIVSVDGAYKTTYEKIRQKGNWYKLIENLDYLYQRNPRPRIRIQMVKQQANEQEEKVFKLRFGHYTTDIVIQNIRSSNKGERRRCPQPWQRLIVAWNGTVFACCSNWEKEFSVGEFPKQSLFGIWNQSPLLHDLRNRAKSFNSNPCKDCTVGASYK